MLEDQAVFQECFCAWALEMLPSESLLSHLNLSVPQFPIYKARFMIFPLSVLPGELISHLGLGKSLNMNLCLAHTVVPGLVRDLM